MKTEEKAQEYAERNKQTNAVDLYHAFLDGYTAANQWVPVGERLPEPMVRVIAFFPTGDEGGNIVSTGYFNGHEVVSDYPNSTASCFVASAWQPLPERPTN